MCEMCKQKFHLQEHQSGLVFDDKFFICEDCRTNTPDQGDYGLVPKHYALISSHADLPVAHPGAEQEQTTVLTKKRMIHRL